MTGSVDHMANKDFKLVSNPDDVHIITKTLHMLFTSTLLTYSVPNKKKLSMHHVMKSKE